MPTLTSTLQDRLRSETRAEVRFDVGSRGLYATDASLYQIEPLGVVIPRTVDDVAIACRIAAEEGVAVIPRGAATSLSGQTIGRGIVFDFSKYLNRIGIVDRDAMRVRVEPGVVLDRLNAHLKPLGLMFAPDVSTSDRATLGGMIGNNSAGARSLRYGKTVDHVHALDVVLDDGTTTRFGPVGDLDAFLGRDDRPARLHRRVHEIVSKHRSEIETRFPRILRRVSGYNLDEFVPGLPLRAEWCAGRPFEFNLARLIVGSEGSLAVITGAELDLVPIPPAQGLVVLSFASIPAALDRLSEILEERPVAVEMLDRMILDLAAKNPEMARLLDFAQGRPGAVLAAQFYADSAEELAERSERLARRFEGSAGVVGVRRSTTDAAKDPFWKVRKAGLSILMGMVGDAKPVAFVEDTAVAPERLPEFYRRFVEIMERNGTEGACYGHADVGCLHIRPVLNVKTQSGLEALESIAREVSDHVVEFGGSMSGEHGDGLARSLWNEKLFGPELYRAFREVKHEFDPTGRLNPGKVIANQAVTENLRLSPERFAVEPETTAFDFEKQGGFARAVEMCSGVGVCRKNTGGTMCPSYMVTLDESHTTRARANALRLVMTGELSAEQMDHEAVAEAMDLCLQCKACKTECPSNVDMSKLKAEWLHQSRKGKPIPLGSLLMGHIDRLSAIGSATAPLANWTLRQGWFKWLLEKTAGIDRSRTLPRFRSDDFRSWFRKRGRVAGASRGRVVLLDDCFTTYNDPDVGRAATRLLEAAGYEVVLAGIECCGRPAISKGLLDRARRLARSAVDRLLPFAEAGVPIVGCEPSCLLTLVDEYRDFRLGPAADVVADACRLADAFLADPSAVPSLPLRKALPGERVMVHGHCQQKALVGTGGTMGALKRIEGLAVRELDSGCCGMAGSFGYELGHREVSEALANRVILPSVAADPEAVLIAPGFSCRSQVHGLANVDAKHPLVYLSERLDPTVREAE
ncbi:MAG: FAD-linked oxidase C-terminal domain-containing protein [Isosphaeraceae bacterium]|nr:FAD-linked oxidase C-terminal domain-containing protein [Isosphaeraceae bacterium]